MLILEYKIALPIISLFKPTSFLHPFDIPSVFLFGIPACIFVSENKLFVYTGGRKGFLGQEASVCLSIYIDIDMLQLMRKEN